jgi:hypothetical protein
MRRCVCPELGEAGLKNRFETREIAVSFNSENTTFNGRARTSNTLQKFFSGVAGSK